MSGSAATVAKTLYVLKLENGKYYVGKTNNLKRRYEEHLAGRGSKWTKRHRPIEIFHQEPCNGFFEDAFVYTYMSRYGIQNVRGGTYSKIRLSKDDRARIEMQFRHAGDQCFVCRSSNHFAKACPQLDVRRGGVEYERDRQHGTRRRVQCSRCGRDSHTEEDCFAATHVRGHSIVPSVEEEDDCDSSDESESDDDSHGCSRCGRNSHSTDDCYARTSVNGDPLSDDSSDESESDDGSHDGCSRCGRNSHIEAHCYARTSANGSRLR
ncbi:ZnF_C2HC [Seminavis robusta]|uniref:ZnF_C2HC n=1 Tax=Seminavis robusta TaxID=568900 RepID=A0A9N8E2Q6_9STRA|nr:ZnF_C2HC [Seminavis robusta]|eukprot:Sro590_g171900.1 ZnF_C2HC (266) ;mRNA; f:40747-41544